MLFFFVPSCIDPFSIQYCNQREAEEEAAIYASFVSSFDGDSSATSGQRFLRAGERPEQDSAPKPKPSLQAMFDPSAGPSAPKKKKAKNIDLFLEELKRYNAVHVDLDGAIHLIASAKRSTISMSNRLELHRILANKFEVNPIFGSDT